LVIQSAIDRKRQQQQLEDALLNAERLLMRQEYDKALDVLKGLESADARVEQMASRIQAQRLEHKRAVRGAAAMAAATELLREQKLDEAVSHLTELLAEFPEDPDVRQHLEYARKEQAAQKRAKAIEEIKASAQQLADAHDYRGAFDVLDQ